MRLLQKEILLSQCPLERLGTGANLQVQIRIRHPQGAARVIFPADALKREPRQRHEDQKQYNRDAAGLENSAAPFIQERRLGDAGHDDQRQTLDPPIASKSDLAVERGV